MAPPVERARLSQPARAAPRYALVDERRSSTSRDKPQVVHQDGVCPGPDLVAPPARRTGSTGPLQHSGDLRLRREPRRFHVADQVVTAPKPHFSCSAREP
jgi:hypothetical protein